MICAPSALRSAWASAQSDQSSLGAQWVAMDPSFHHADSEYSNQTGRIPTQPELSLRWAYMSFSWFCPAAAYFLSLSPLSHDLPTQISIQITASLFAV